MCSRDALCFGEHEYLDDELCFDLAKWPHVAEGVGAELIHRRRRRKIVQIKVRAEHPRVPLALFPQSGDCIASAALNQRRGDSIHTLEPQARYEPDERCCERRAHVAGPVETQAAEAVISRIEPRPKAEPQGIPRQHRLGAALGALHQGP